MTIGATWPHRSGGTGVTDIFATAQIGLYAHLVRSALDGLRYLRSHSTLLANTVILTVAALLSSGTFTLAYGYATEVTGTGAFGYSIIEAAVGLGAVAGGLAVGRWGEQFPKGPLILAGLVVTGTADASLAFFENSWLAVGAQAFAGAGHMLLLTQA